MASININHHSVIKIFLPQPLSASFPSCISSVDSTSKYLFVLNKVGHSFHGIEYQIYFCIVMQDGKNLPRRQNYGTMLGNCDKPETRSWFASQWGWACLPSQSCGVGTDTFTRFCHAKTSLWCPWSNNHCVYDELIEYSPIEMKLLFQFHQLGAEIILDNFTLNTK